MGPDEHRPDHQSEEQYDPESIYPNEAPRPVFKRVPGSPVSSIPGDSAPDYGSEPDEMPSEERENKRAYDG